MHRAPLPSLDPAAVDPRALGLRVPRPVLAAQDLLGLGRPLRCVETVERGGAVVREIEWKGSASRSASTSRNPTPAAACKSASG